MSDWTIAGIKHLILTNDKMVERSVFKLYEYQTESEKLTQEVLESNGVGFNGVDSKILSSFAEFYIKTGFLTQKQIIYARKKIMKYSKQLLNIANSQHI